VLHGTRCAVGASAAEFRLGNRSPAGRTRWARYDLDSGAEIQRLWWQNIGVWSVVITNPDRIRKTDAK